MIFQGLGYSGNIEEIMKSLVEMLGRRSGRDSKTQKKKRNTTKVY